MATQKQAVIWELLPNSWWHVLRRTRMCESQMRSWFFADWTTPVLATMSLCPISLEFITKYAMITWISRAMRLVSNQFFWRRDPNILSVHRHKGVCRRFIWRKILFPCYSRHPRTAWKPTDHGWVQICRLPPHFISMILSDVLQKRPETPTLKNRAIEYLRNTTKSFDYTLAVLNKLEQQARGEVERLGGNPILSALLDKLHVDAWNIMPFLCTVLPWLTGLVDPRECPHHMCPLLPVVVCTIGKLGDLEYFIAF